VYPHYLAPTPSMAVVQLQPNLREGALADGFVVPRDTVLRGRLGRREQTACEYWTKHDLTLWPVELARAEYTTLLTDLGEVRIPGVQRPKAMLRLRLRATAGLRFDQLALDALPLFLGGGDELATRLYEQLVSSAVAIVARPLHKKWQEVIGAPCLAALGFDDSEALLPYGPRSFQGYRLLHEYFAFPQRYLFVELRGLSSAVRRCDATEVELLVLLEREDATLEGLIDVSRLKLFCTPAINLFPRQADRIHLNERENEYHVVPDRTRPMDLEIHSVSQVVGYGTRADSEREFLPLYAAHDTPSGNELPCYFTIQRQPRLPSSRQRAQGTRSTYIGSEVFVSLVDADAGPFRPDLRQLAVTALCTNRDLPLHMSVGQGDTDFTLQSGAPVEAVRCLAGPSAPRPSHVHSELARTPQLEGQRPSQVHGDVPWRLISHLSLNYLSLIDSDPRSGAAALREMLSLYADLGDPAVRKQIDGVRAIRSQAVTRRLPFPGPIAFGRGIEVTLECDEAAFRGSGAFVLGSVLERFFAKYVSINSFTETVLRTLQRGEVMRWPMTSGQRPAL
jgi:type VI secretion system protein ImpG